MNTPEKNISLFKNKDFLLLFSGGLVSRIGNGIHNIALVWFVLELTGSGTATGTIMLLSYLPGVLMGPFSGVLVDKLNRKFLIVGMDIIRGLVVIWLSWVIYLGNAGFFHVGIATVLIAISNSFFNPAIEAVLPLLIRDKNLQSANSLEHFSLNFSQIIGAGIGGFLIALTGISGVFLINGISFLLSAFSELFIDIPPVINNNTEKKSFLDELKFGFRFLHQSRAILALFSLAIFLNFLFTGLAMVGLPFVFKQVLNVNSKLFGIFQSVFPAGAVIGALILSFKAEIKNFYKVLMSTLLFQGLLIILIGLPISPYILSSYSLFYVNIVLIIVLFIMGLSNSIVNIPIKVILQRLVPDHLRGRIFGLLSTFSQGLIPVSMALTGFLLDRVPAYLLFIYSGIATTILILYAARLETLKKLGKEPKSTRAMK